MGDAQRDIWFLVDYWRNGGNVFDAQKAMRSLVEQAAEEPKVRASFAANSIFEVAMLSEASGTTTAQLAKLAEVLAVAGKAPGNALESPRQIMLDGIYEAATGGWLGWGPKDPSGVTMWLHSTDVSAAAVLYTLKSDPSADARAAMLKLLQDVAIPAYWASFLKAQRAFASLNEQLMTAVWSDNAANDQASRKTLAQLSATAEGRVDSTLAQAAMADLPKFPMGDGQLAPTLPPPRTPWYRNVKLLGAGGVGLIAGGIVATRR